MKLCQCGCQLPVTNDKNIFLRGHSNRGLRGEATSRYGTKTSEETKRKLSEALSGEKHPMYNKKHTEESKTKMTQSHRGCISPMLGRNHSEETKRKLSEINKGKKHTEETKQKLSEISKGIPKKPLTKEHKQKLSEINQGKYLGEKSPCWGKKLTEEHKQKLKIARSKRITKDETRLKMMISRMGNKAIKWIDGRSYGEYGDAWGDKEYEQYILERDNNQCQCPDHRPEWETNRLNRHHIDFDKTNHHYLNLITLCIACHIKIAHSSDKNIIKQYLKKL